MKATALFSVFISLFVIFFALPSCGDDDDDDSKDSEPADDDDDEIPSDALIFQIDDIDAIREGLLSKDGWQLSFEHFYVNFYGPIAVQIVEEEVKGGEIIPLHPGHPHNDIPEGSAYEALTGDFFVDLSAGQTPIDIGMIEGVAVGNYNRLYFSIRTAQEDSRDLISDYLGYSIVMIGVAKKDGQSLPFVIYLVNAFSFYECPVETPEGVVGDGDAAHIRISLRIEHVFGDGRYGSEEGTVNPGAAGFQPFADLAVDGAVDITQSEFAYDMDRDTYDALIAALKSMGYSSGGACESE